MKLTKAKNKKWNRSLGTSKREQGIITPSMPNRSTKAKKKARKEGKLKAFLKRIL